MKIFVQNKENNPLMPTNPRKARLLLKTGKAKIVKHDPFTIRLVHGSSGYNQPVVLGIDSGYNDIGFSAVSKNEEIFSGELTLLKGHSERLKERKMYRRTRRSHLRYRKPRFDNRHKKEKWIAPSLKHKLDTHLQFINLIQSIIPIKQIVIEVGSFNIQKIKNSTISGEEYQQGDQQGFWNLREYILHRDNHECQNPNCKNKAKTKKLQVHHVGYWKQDRSDRPANLITLCTKCHIPANHEKNGFLYGWEPKVKSFKSATFMSILRQRMVSILHCDYTYGYITKGKRLELDLPKSHYNDAFVIANGTNQKRAQPIFMEQIARNNRRLQTFRDAKYIDNRTGKKVNAQVLNNGRRTRNKNLSTENLRKYRGLKLKKGGQSIRRHRYPYQPKDIVSYNSKKYIIKASHNYGKRVFLYGTSKSINVNLITPIKKRKGLCSKV